MASFTLDNTSNVPIAETKLLRGDNVAAMDTPPIDTSGPVVKMVSDNMKTIMAQLDADLDKSFAAQMERFKNDTDADFYKAVTTFAMSLTLSSRANKYFLLESIYRAYMNPWENLRTIGEELGDYTDSSFTIVRNGVTISFHDEEAAMCRIMGMPSDQDYYSVRVPLDGWKSYSRYVIRPYSTNNVSMCWNAQGQAFIRDGGIIDRTNSEITRSVCRKLLDRAHIYLTDHRERRVREIDDSIAAIGAAIDKIFERVCSDTITTADIKKIGDANDRIATNKKIRAEILSGGSVIRPANVGLCKLYW